MAVKGAVNQRFPSHFAVMPFDGLADIAVLLCNSPMVAFSHLTGHRTILFRAAAEPQYH